MKICVESPEVVLTEYEEKEIDDVIAMLKVARGIFGDSSLRCVYLLKAENMLRKLIENIVDSHM